VTEPRTSEWKPIGETSNTRYFEVESEIIAAVPNPGAKDDQASARENQSFQNEHWQKSGHGGVVIVFFDRLVAQDKEARRVYGSEADEKVMRGTALVGGSMLGRAMASFFLGISKPRIPVKMFDGVDRAIAWAHHLNQAAAK
jgi:hypothetical protein